MQLYNLFKFFTDPYIINGDKQHIVVLILEWFRYKIYINTFVMNSIFKMLKGMKRTTAVIIFLIIIVTIPIDVSADRISEVVTIQPGEYETYEFKYSSRIWLTYDVEVLSGPNIDVIITNEEGLKQIQDPFLKMSYISSYSKLDTRHARFSDRIESGHYFIIIDNSNIGNAKPNDQPVEVLYSINTKRADFLNPFASLNTIDWAKILILAVLIIITIAVITMRNSNSDDVLPHDQSHQLQLYHSKNMVTICPNCSSHISPDSEICEACGKRL